MTCAGAAQRAGRVSLGVKPGPHLIRAWVALTSQPLLLTVPIRVAAE